MICTIIHQIFAIFSIGCKAEYVSLDRDPITLSQLVGLLPIHQIYTHSKSRIHAYPYYRTWQRVAKSEPQIIHGKAMILDQFWLDKKASARCH